MVAAKAVAFKSDQADMSRASALIDDVVAHFGGLDILVNNAAISQAGTVDDPDADTAALDRMHATGDRMGEAQTLNHVGLLELELGETREALTRFGQALETFRALEKTNETTCTALGPPIGGGLLE